MAWPMSRFPPRAASAAGRARLGSALGAALALSASPAGAAASPPPSPLQLPLEPIEDTAEIALSGRRLVLAVWIDGTPEDAPVYAREADGTLWLSRDDLVRLGLLRPPRTDAPVAASDSAEVALAALTGLSYRFDPAEQRLDITSWAAAKRSNRIALGGDQADSRLAVPVSANTAALALNYDASARIDGDGTALAGLVEARLSLPHGAGLAAMRFGPDGRGGAEAVRLDSRFDLYDAGRDRIWRFGDTIAVGGANARAVRLGGVQLLGDFATRPDLVTRPLPGFAGQVAVPSALDLLVDGRRVGGGEVAPGDFSVTNVPTITGRGTVDLVVRDALGRAERQSISFYANPALLRAGLDETSIALGAVRQGYGRDSFDYGTAALIAAHRHGLSDRTTLVAHAELTPRLANLGGGAAITLAGLAAVHLDATISHDRSASQGPSRGAWGYRLVAAIESIGDPFSLTARIATASPDYRDIAGLDDGALPRLELIASAGLDLGAWGSADLGYAWREAVPADPTRRRAAARPEVSLLTASWRAALGRRVDFGVQAFHDLNPGGATSILLGPTISLGGNAIAAGFASLGADGRDASAVLTRPDVLPGQTGYRLSADLGTADRLAALISHRREFGRGEAGIETVDGRLAGRLSLSGALVLSDAGPLFAQAIDGAYGIVDLRGIDGVAIRQDYRAAGRTNRRGYLLIPRLNAWTVNRIGYDPLALPDLAIAGDDLVAVRPMEGGAVRIGFDIALRRPYSLLIEDEAGLPLAPGLSARIEGATGADAAELITGFDGTLFVPDGGRPLTIAVTRLDGSTCTVRASIPTDLPPLSRAGPYRCQATGI